MPLVANTFKDEIVNHLLGILLLLVFAGLSSQYVLAQQGSQTSCDSPVDVEFGSRRPILDGAGWVLGAPKKLLMWNRRVDNHAVSDQTVNSVTKFLTDYRIDNVKVRVNQYDPIGEWRRLVDNDRISPGWKYSIGTLNHLGYALLPGRLFGGDNYNPYTNTVSLYSDVPAMGLAESAYASDVHARRHPGTYAFVQSLPIVSMWHESLATDEVMTYMAIRGNQKEIDATRQVLYARYGISLGGELGRVLPDGSAVFQVFGAGAGHLLAAHQRKDYR